MPFYRMPIGTVHLKGSKLPAPCGARTLIDGREQVCMAFSGYLCDAPDPSHRSGTCDRALCDAHAREVGPNRQFCPACHQSHRDADPQRGLFTSIV